MSYAVFDPISEVGGTDENNRKKLYFGKPHRPAFSLSQRNGKLTAASISFNRCKSTYIILHTYYRRSSADYTRNELQEDETLGLNLVEQLAVLSFYT
jgi:hypothetical protein